MPEDHALSESILRALGSDRTRICGNYADRESFLDELAALDLFVGVKLHTVISACCVSTPAIMIGYQPKCLDFMRTMVLEDYHVRADRLDLDHLVDMIRVLFGDLHSHQRKQFEAVQSVRSRLLEFRDEVMASLGTLPKFRGDLSRARSRERASSQSQLVGLEQPAQSDLR